MVLRPVFQLTWIDHGPYSNYKTPPSDLPVSFSALAGNWVPALQHGLASHPVARLLDQGAGSLNAIPSAEVSVAEASAEHTDAVVG